ncbi:YeeE/YedE family protein [Marinobacter sp. TBZ242]|uniref:YeeE/YedE family protein n=1 Tax=Marinobacter azerbaijanicus TaxID=3050455 RepID=A0ABT7IKS9_9GAMM|nr:YeeE/YedE family protein [Marinobacter sp. TBZ242]MDL0433743.1 YeeE/YedE family protein [Marinobacter sp. TBZ242]
MDWTSNLQGLFGGILIGISATWLMATLGRVTGISGIAGTLVTARPKGDSAWRAAFLAGLVTGPILLVLAGGDLGNVVNEPNEIIGDPAGGVLSMLIAGLLVGVGTGLGSGCTSGHGVCGLARLSPRSMAATGTFLLSAVVTVYVARHIVGGGA